MNSNDLMKKLPKNIVKIVKTMRKMQGFKNRPPYTPELHLPTPFFSYLESRHIGKTFFPYTKKSRYAILRNLMIKITIFEN